MTDERITPQSEPKRGRPRVENALRSCVTVSLPERVHDQLIATAQVKRMSVSALVRDLILSHQRP
jgi:hypothetical protein